MRLIFSFPPQNISDIFLLAAGLGVVMITFIYHKRSIKAREKLKRRNRFLREIITKLRSMELRITTDLKAARQIQLGMLPSQIPQVKGMRLDVIYQPVIEVGGDIYDFFRFDDNKLGIFIGDASGHGFAPSLIGTLSKMSLHHNRRSAQSASGLISAINNDLTANINSNNHMTCFWGVFDFEKNKLTYSSAGHPKQLVLRKDGTLYNLRSGGTLLGLFENAPFQQDEFCFEDGDRFFLFTDGIYEVINKNLGLVNEAMDCNQFARLVVKTLGKPFDATLRTIMEDLSHFKHEDDYTLIIAEICGGGKAQSNQALLLS